MKITVAHGDGNRTEVMDAVLSIFEATSVPLEYDVVQMGAKEAVSGNETGIGPEARESVESTGVLFKGPMATPKGGGHKSVNVTARKMWGTFANKRVYRILPGVPTPLQIRDLNLTMVRENIEDTYGAVEHMQTHDVAQCRRFITKPGSEQVHRYTFEMAARKGAKRVTCGHKANIMKLTDGLFLETFYEVAAEYPNIEANDVIIDAFAMKLVHDPSEFDVIVMPNLQGDILTDLAAGLVGGLAYAPSANLGDGISIFEAVHGTAPDIVGRDMANPTALLLSGTMMLRHIELSHHAAVIEEALDRVLLAGQRSQDPAQPRSPFSTQRFVQDMVAALDDAPSIEATPKYEVKLRTQMKMNVTESPDETRLLGIDIFLESDALPEAVANRLESIDGPLQLTMISNRGTQVWPSGSAYTDCINHYRVRFEAQRGASQDELVWLMGTVAEMFPLCGSEWLRELDGKRGFSLAQGQ